MTSDRIIPTAVTGLIVAMGVAWCAGCSDGRAGCTTALGAESTRRVVPDGAVTSLTVYDRIDVEWSPVQDTLGPRLTWTAGEGVIDGLDAAWLDGELVLSDANACAWVRRLDAVPKVRLEGMAFREVRLEGQGRFSMIDTLRTGDLRVEGDEMAGDAVLLFDGDTLQVRMPNGIGDVRLAGRARRLRTFRSGFGELDARGLETGQALVHHAGLGDVHLTAPGYLFLEMAGAGDAYIHGTPQQEVILMLEGGTGTVHHQP